MKRREYQVNNTGNSVANYTEIKHICELCEGAGVVCSNMAEDDIDCPECGGKGYWTEHK